MTRAFHLTKPVWASNSHSQSHMGNVTLLVLLSSNVHTVTVFKAQNNCIQSVHILTLCKYKKKVI